MLPYLQKIKSKTVSEKYLKTYEQKDVKFLEILMCEMYYKKVLGKQISTRKIFLGFRLILK